MNASTKVLYTARTHTAGGRENGSARSDDGQLDVRLSPPGLGRVGANPEQLFAAGWSACFESAIGLVAKKKRIELPGDVTIAAEVDLAFSTAEGYSLAARLTVTIPGVDRALAQALMDEAHTICPYSKATRGNIGVTITLA
ncbi:organic hydroperoxide resistance protein [Nitrospirillum sp. BR 11164]|uniref:organic hydroperoxide resistance protein n=1 Tax=Nitrospirillum sp. BR 11164 TaxID=3104324 RepID=UPI002AFE35F5|nr:organic hydroperoxide resistance protein [Nitrospirillum sp. BR 11164]MEA1648878.1 organic hydroperoxide resistance protein [Nitrospirillum sp. BR 11164]